MNSNTLIFISISICFIILGFFYLDRSGYFDPMKEVIKTDTVLTTKTDTLWKDTTIVEKEIVPKYIIKKKGGHSVYKRRRCLEPYYWG